MLKLGDKAPDFILKNTGGKDVKLADFYGKKVILWFYPKASTPGWTVQGQGFRDEYQKFQDQGIIIVGVSADSVQKNKNFKIKQEFQYELLSDENKEMIQKYGAWVKKKMYGKEYMGIIRTTIIIKANRKVHKVWNNVRVKDHAKEVLEELRNI